MPDELIPSNPSRLLALRRTLVVVSVIGVVWALAIAGTGGFLVRFGALRISSRNPFTPSAIALVAAVAVWLLGRVPAAQTSRAREIEWWSVRARHLRAAAGAGLAILLVPAVAVTVAAVWIDILQWLRAPPLWLDEQMIALNVRDRSMLELKGALWLGQSAPLGWLVVQRALLVLLGTSELVLRLVPLLFGIATVAAAAWIGLRWMGRLSAALFVVVCSLAPWLSHFRFELKHYSADILFALLLPALAAWSLEGRGTSNSAPRWVIWWTVAAAGQWFGNGALFVTPAVALAAASCILWREGWRGLLPFGVGSLIWGLAFAAHYELSLRYTHENRYLRQYWASEIPAASMTVSETMAWIARRLGPLASNPGGTTFPALLWLCASLGFVFSRRRALGLLFATVPLSAFVLAALRFVPLHERFSVWIVPALFAGVALLADRLLAEIARGMRARRGMRTVAAGLLAVAPLLVAADVTVAGWQSLDIDAPPDSNHGLDDRGAVAWLMQHRRAGAAILTTRLGWPAIWWYGRIPLDRAWPDARLPDGTVMYQVSHQTEPSACDPSVADVLRSHSRVLVYVGFPDMPGGFGDLLLHELWPLGTIRASREFADRSRVWVIDTAETPGSRVPPVAAGEGRDTPLHGCIGIAPVVRRW